MVAAAAAEVNRQGAFGLPFPTRRTMNSIVKQIRDKADSVIVGFSCGKDSVVTLDVCSRYFPRVEVFFMYLVPGLSFQERYIEYIESRYHIEVLRYPHWQLGGMIQSASFRPYTKDTRAPTLEISDIENQVRHDTGLHWIAYGSKISDSLERRAMIKQCGGVSERSGRFYPIAGFNKEAVLQHMIARNILAAPDYQYWGRSFGRLWYDELAGIKEHYPNDYQKILEYFPYAEAVIKKREFAGADQVSKIREGDDQPKRNKKRAIQSKAH